MTERLLLVTPSRRDAELAEGFLAGAGFELHPCADLQELCDEVNAGAGAVLLTDDLLGRGNPDALAAVLRQQPPWSDLPVVLLSPRGADSATAVWAMNALTNVTVLEQPVRVDAVGKSNRSKRGRLVDVPWELTSMTKLQW